MLHRNKKNIQKMLFSELHIRAILKSSILDIRSKIEAISGLKEISYGTSIRYTLISAKEEIYQEISFSKTTIDLRYYFRRKESYHKTRALLNLIAIMNLLSEAYDFSLESIYKYIIEVLADSINITNQQNEREVIDSIIKEKIDAMSTVNFHLSKELINSKRALHQADSSLKISKIILDKIIERISENYCSKIDVDVLKLVGINEDLILQYNQIMGN